MSARFLFALPLLAIAAGARELPATKPGLIPADVPVITADGKTQMLRSLWSGPNPVLVLPLFTQCSSICPIAVRHLKKTLTLTGQKTPLNVILFDFDAGESLHDVAKFRQDKEIPAAWSFVRAADAGSVRNYFDQLDYHFMHDDGTFVHPNELFIFSGKGAWSGIITGNDYTESDLQKAYQQAEDIDRPSLWKQVTESASLPETWILLGGFGFLAALGTIAAVLRSRRSSP